MNAKCKKKYSIRIFFEQLKDLFKSFFILPKVKKEDILNPSKEAIKSGVKVQLFTLADSILVSVFAFMLKLTNSAITNSLILFMSPFTNSTL